MMATSEPTMMQMGSCKYRYLFILYLFSFRSLELVDNTAQVIHPYK